MHWSVRVFLVLRSVGAAANLPVSFSAAAFDESAREVSITGSPPTLPMCLGLNPLLLSGHLTLPSAERLSFSATAMNTCF
jgi:hypothetical protein